MVIDGHCLECDGNDYHTEDCPHRTIYNNAYLVVIDHDYGLKCSKVHFKTLNDAQKYASGLLNKEINYEDGSKSLITNVIVCKRL